MFTTWMLHHCRTEARGHCPLRLYRGWPTLILGYSGVEGVGGKALQDASFIVLIISRKLRRICKIRE